MLAEVFLELAKQASRKTGLLLEVYVVEAPLVLKEWLQMLNGAVVSYELAAG